MDHVEGRRVMAKSTSLAFNADRLRQLLWQRVAPPPEMLQKALEKLDSQLDAKETKFFVHQGLLVSQADVEAHAIQQNAAIAIAKIADAMPRDRAEKAAPPTVTLEIKDGVFRLHIGAVPHSSGEESAYEVSQIINEPPESTETALAPTVPRPLDIADASPGESDAVDDEEPPVQVIRMRDFADKREAMRLLMADDDGPAK